MPITESRKADANIYLYFCLYFGSILEVKNQSPLILKNDLASQILSTGKFDRLVAVEKLLF